MKKCKHYNYIDNVSYCNKLNCVCRCQFCKLRANCSIFESCYRKEYTVIDDAIEIYKIGVKNLTKSLHSLKGSIPVRDFYSSLLYTREYNILNAFANSPADLNGAYFVNQYFTISSYPKDIEPKLTKNMYKFIQRLHYRDLFIYYLYMLRRNDLIFYATENGYKELLKVKDDTINYVEKKLTEIEKTPQQEEFFSSYTIQMIPVINWCIKNNISFDLTHPVINDYFLEKLSKNTNLKDRSKANHSESWYNFLKTILIYMFKYRELRKTIDIFRKHLYGTNLNSEAYRSPLRIEAHRRLKELDWYSESSLPDIEAPWPLVFNGKSLWGSSILISIFISDRIRDISTSPKTKGWVFEDKLMVELIDRNCKIIAKDIDTPIGEIDLIVQKGTKVWVSELKDYNIWYDNWYASSKNFIKRQKVLKDFIKKFDGKVNWIRKNKDYFKLTSEEIEGIVITSFNENLNFSNQINIINKIDIDEAFGKSKYKTFHEIIYNYGKKQENNLNKEIKIPYSIAKVCPFHPGCIYMGPLNEKDPVILRSYYTYNAYLKKPLCPFLKVHCMWVYYCSKGEDPCFFLSSQRLHY